MQTGTIMLSNPDEIMSIKEIAEFKKLKENLMGKNSFVIMENTTEWERFNELSGKWINYAQYIKRMSTTFFQ